MAEPTLLPERLQYRPTKIELDESIEKAKATLLKKIKRSVYVYRVDCGGCNGCEIEIFGSITPVFDVERFGIKVVPSPRHADVLLYTGAVTRAMRMPALRAFEAAPDPKIVVSYGACGCTGGIFLSLIHISEPTRRTPISYAVFCLKKKKNSKKKKKNADVAI